MSGAAEKTVCALDVGSGKRASSFPFLGQWQNGAGEEKVELG